MNTKTKTRKKAPAKKRIRIDGAKLFDLAASLDDGRGPDPAALHADIERKLKKFKPRKGETQPEIAHRLAIEVGIDPHGNLIDDCSV